jgi:hypothetical protein
VVKGAAFSLGLALVLGAAQAAYPDSVRQRESRLRPPSTLDCPRDRANLTAYSGSVIKYARGSVQTTVQIKTDWDTTEAIVINHKGSDPTKWFLYGGEPLTPIDWQSIADAGGQLRPGIRATAWVCSNGSNPIVDWERPKK